MTWNLKTSVSVFVAFISISVVAALGTPNSAKLLSKQCNSGISYEHNGNGSWSSSVTTTYSYDATSYYKLNSINIASVFESGGTPNYTNVTDNCLSTVQDSMGLQYIHYVHNTPNNYPDEMRILDAQERLCHYQYISSAGAPVQYKNVYYGVHTQPDSIVVCHLVDNSYVTRKWVYQYDAQERKSTIGYYEKNGSGIWVYQGTYHLSYAGQYTQPIDPLCLHDVFYDDLALFDANWAFDNIVFSPASGQPDTLSWQCTSTTPVTLESISPPGYEVITKRYTFNANNKLYQYYQNNYIDLEADATTTNTYNWFVGVPNQDDTYASTPTIELNPNKPNPFSSETSINYKTKASGYTSLKIYNLKGELICRLVDETKQAGTYTSVWDGRDSQNKQVKAGVYLYKLISNGHCLTGKMVFVR